MRALAPIALSIAALTARGQPIVEVTPLDVRPLGEDYSPVPLDSGFVMCSVREAQSTIDFKDANTGKPLSDLYWVPYKDGVAGTPVLFSAVLATPVNEGPATFTDGGRTICYTRNLVLPRKLSNLRGSEAQLGLFFSRMVNDAWQAPEPFVHNSPKHSIIHPSFSSTGDTLCFVSDMPGGNGGMDLWLCVRTHGGWSAPRNLGSMVNSPYNEGYPRFFGSKLFFASDRPGGMGKLDVYETAAEDEDWQIPLPLPEPVNGPGHDFGWYPYPDGRSALFSSDRDGEERIYLGRHTVPKFRDCTEQRKNNYCYAFKSRPHAATSTLPLDHLWDLGDGTSVKGLMANHCYKEPGRYEVRSMLVDRKTGATFYTLRTEVLEVSDLVQAYIASPDTVRTGRNMVLDPRLSHVPDIVPEEYHWDLGDGTSKTGPKVTHQYKAPGTYTVRLDILGAPDADGTIRNHCNTKTITVIDRYREHEDIAVTAVYQDALGKTHSFEYQELPHDMFSLSSEELGDVRFAVELFASRERISLDDPRFEKVRRYYRVIEQYDPHRGEYLYLVGETNDLEELYQVFRKVKELQYLDAEVFVLQQEKLIDLSRLDLASLEELNRSKLSLNTLHFAYKSAELMPGADEILDKVVAMMRQHPEVKLVIEAHTDDIGSRAYNLDLSQQRAATVVAYLTANGVAAERLLAIGHGKNKPVASNKTEEGRSRNRRVEFRMSLEEERTAHQRTQR